VNRSELVKALVDTSLVYNTALAAFEAGNWERAVHYLTELHDAAHHPATTLLLYRACEGMQDSIRAEEVLMEALDIYHYDRQVVVYLVNLLASTDRYELAVDILDQAIEKHPEEDQFHWGKGLIYRRLGNREGAIESFKKAIELNPDEAKLYYHVGVIYYNMGVDLRKASLRVIDSQEYLELKARSLEKFRESVHWMEQSYALNPYDEQSIQRLRQLYNELQMKDKEASMQRLLE